MPFHGPPVKQTQPPNCYYSMEKLTYVILLLGSVAVPLFRSFESNLRFYRQWPRFILGVLVMMLVFIPWDIAFTHYEIWSFNHLFFLGITLAGLPLEEWLFFLIIPYCIVFTYEVLRHYLPSFSFPGVSMVLSLLLGLSLIVTGLLHVDKVYTLVVMLLTGALAIWQPVTGAHKRWLSHFYLTFLVMLLPFLLVNGILTGMPVVQYDDTQNLAIRLWSIPVEDMVYLLGMMFVVHMVYEHPFVKKTF